ncbi:DoxX family membrane protein [Lapillicoccus sp.]|uniref:DoxX family membrane protein n=1 Tax=Lapillicoccus sp. TaxID=1909287 RepID=UPI0025CBE46A|nr:DoxX family membrane protein [Lapillicoccus sp.]
MSSPLRNGTGRAETGSPRTVDPASAELMAKAFTALRVFTGLVWLTNGLAKVIGRASYDLGFLSFNLVDRGVAEEIARDASSKTYIAPLGAFYRDVVLPNYGFFGWFLTLAELAVGLGLLLGVLPRAAALGGLLLIGPVWLMLLHTNLYLWQYPAEDLFPLVLLTVVPTWGRFDLAQRIRGRLPRRWPF